MRQLKLVFSILLLSVLLVVPASARHSGHSGRGGFGRGGFGGGGRHGGGGHWHGGLWIPYYYDAPGWDYYYYQNPWWYYWRGGHRHRFGSRR